MKNNKKIVRNMAVFCAKSMLRNAGIDIESWHKYDKEPLGSTTEHILSDVFKEQTDYRTLLDHYSEALQGNENAYFSYADFCDKNHAIRIDGAGNIILYFYQDRPQIGTPWDYPHLITRIGTVDDNATSRSVLNDLKKLSALDFFMKYYIRGKENADCINSIPEGYLVNGFLKIIVDDHITFQWVDLLLNYHEKYIADSWAETKEDIIKDLTNMSLLKFGKKYLACWGR